MSKKPEISFFWTEKLWNAVPIAVFLLIFSILWLFCNLWSKTVNIKANKKNCNRNLCNFINSLATTQGASNPDWGLAKHTTEPALQLPAEGHRPWPEAKLPSGMRTRNGRLPYLLASFFWQKINLSHRLHGDRWNPASPKVHSSKTFRFMPHNPQQFVWLFRNKI